MANKEITVYKKRSALCLFFGHFFGFKLKEKNAERNILFFLSFKSQRIEFKQTWAVFSNPSKVSAFIMSIIII